MDDERGRHYLWTGWHNGQGHGKISIGGKAKYVHRLIYSWFHRIALSRWNYVDHQCERKGCINVDHLEHVSPAVNTARGPGRHHQFKKPEDYDGASAG